MTKPTCDHHGCNSTSENPLRRGMCPKHYTRWRRHGDANTLKVQRRATPLVLDLPWSRVAITSTCWLWTGSRTTEGYGKFRTLAAHRVFYRALVGPVPPHMDLDHLCRVRHCVRPDHMEPVTHGENVRRGWDARRAVA